MNRPTAIGILKGFALTVLFLLVVPSASATNLIFDTAGNIIGSYAEASHNAINAAYGINASSTGKVAVGAVNVPVVVERQVSKAAIAKAAGKIAAKAIPGVATAAAIAELCTLLCPGNNYQIAPDGASLRVPEKPDVAGDPLGTGYFINSEPGVISKSAISLCSNHAAAGVRSVFGANWTGTGTLGTVSGQLVCKVYRTGLDGATYFWTDSPIVKKPNYYVPEYILPTDVQTEADVLARAEQQARFKPLYDAIMADRAANPTAWPADYNPIKPTTPVVVTAPPVSSPERVVSTTTKSGANGSTDTTTTTEKTVVTPTTTGTTVGDSQTTFPTQTVTTNTTVNNVTNNTTTETTTVNHPAETTPTTPGETDNSPRECGTPGRPKCQIDETGTPEGKTVYQTESTKVDTAFDDMQTKLTTVTSQDGKDTSWGWSPTSWFSAGQCEPFDFGEMPTLNMNLAFDVCPHLQKAQELLSFMWVLSTIGVILAMVWETMNSQGA
jgi:hypothetical protein